jgi:hypothetical protein
MADLNGTTHSRSVTAQYLISLAFILFVAAYYANSAANKMAEFDFGPAFYTAAKIVTHGDSQHLYDFDLQRKYQLNEIAGVGPLYYYPSPVALLFIPLSFLSPSLAYFSWVVVSFHLLLLTAFILDHALHLAVNPFHVFAALCAFLPVHLELIQGQVDLLLVLILASALALMGSGRVFLAGMVLSLGLIKFQFILPAVAVYALRGRWRILGGFALGSAFFMALSLAMVRLQGLAQYIWAVRNLRAHSADSIHPEQMANLRGLISVFANQQIGIWLVGALSVAMILWTARQDPAKPTGFAAMILASMLVSFHSNPHSLVLLIIPLAVAWPPTHFRSVNGLLFLVLATPILLAPALYLHRTAVFALPILAFWFFTCRLQNSAGHPELANGTRTIVSASAQK